jgi:hypothetical protein
LSGRAGPMLKDFSLKAKAHRPQVTAPKSLVVSCRAEQGLFLKDSSF